MASRKPNTSRTGARRASAPKPEPASRAKPRPARRAKPARARRASRTDAPELFRLNIEVADIAAAATFYGELLGQPGRMQAGSRVYFAAGAVTLQVVATAAPHVAAKALYFTVRDLDAVHARARALDCLSAGRVHGTPAGDAVVRPWGERSFYADDPWGNPLCFVAHDTVYRG